MPFLLSAIVLISLSQRIHLEVGGVGSGLLAGSGLPTGGGLGFLGGLGPGPDVGFAPRPTSDFGKSMILLGLIVISCISPIEMQFFYLFALNPNADIIRN